MIIFRRSKSRRDLGFEGVMLATLIPAGLTLGNQGVKQSVRDRCRTEFVTWRWCRVRRLDVLRAAESSGIEVELEEA